MASETARAENAFELKRAGGSDQCGDGTQRDSSGEGVSDRLAGERDALPAAIHRKYYVADVGRSQELNIYADSKGEYLVFKAGHDHITTRVASAEIVRDMVAIAAHRGWTRIELTGALEFRREAWLTAAARGIEAKGYEATPLDHAAAAKLRGTKTRASGDTRRGADHSASDRSTESMERNVSQTTPRNALPSRDDPNGRSQMAVIERVALAAFPKDAKVRQRVVEVARKRIDLHRQYGGRFDPAEVTERSSVTLRTADAAMTLRLREADKVPEVRGERSL